MKSLVVVLGSLMIAQAFAGESLWSGDSAFSQEELCEEIDPYQRFLNEKQLINIHSYAYIKGDSEEQTSADNFFTILNVNERTIKIEEILQTDADVLCVQEINTHSEGHDLYNKLKQHYAHFYIETSDASLTLVASKYFIENPFYVYFEEGFGMFDFEIVTWNKGIGHIYLTKITDPNCLEPITCKMELDYAATKDKTPFVLCGELGDFINSYNKNFIISACNEQSQSAFLFQPTELIEQHYYLTQQKNTQGSVLSIIHSEILLKSNWIKIYSDNALLICQQGGSESGQNNVQTPPPAPKNKIEVQGKQSTDGQSSAALQYSRTEANPKGSSTQFGVGIEAERNPQGDASGQIKVFGVFEW